jgi:hypothetical protein
LIRHHHAGRRELERAVHRSDDGDAARDREQAEIRRLGVIQPNGATDTEQQRPAELSRGQNHIRACRAANA